MCTTLRVALSGRGCGRISTMMNNKLEQQNTRFDACMIDGSTIFVAAAERILIFRYRCRWQTFRCYPNDNIEFICRATDASVNYYLYYYCGVGGSDVVRGKFDAILFKKKNTTTKERKEQKHSESEIDRNNNYDL